jgi:DNA-binding GntR family transcriptional regulator
MRMLESSGYLLFTPYKGWAVKEISIAEIQEVYLVRAHLASLAAELACKNLREPDLRRLEDTLTDMAVVVTRGEVHEYFALNLTFHNLIERVSGNRPLVRIMESLDKMTLRYRFLSLSLPGRLERSLDEHSRMVKAFRERDPEAAARIAKESALNSGKLLMEYVFKHHPSMEPLVF